MENLTNQNRIKPFLTQTIHIKSPSTYKTYLIRRPKHTLTLKFTRQTRLSRDIRDHQTKAELKLQKALSLLKSVKKVDLSQFELNYESINQNRLQFCLKRISKISTFQWTRNQLDNQLKANPVERSFKYLHKLHSLAYELTNQGFRSSIQPRDKHFAQRIKDDPLNHLKYHPKMKSLQLETSGHGCYFSRVFSEGLKRYPTSLKNLSITSLLNTNFALYLERFVKLKSVNLKFSDYDGCDDLILQNLSPLSGLPNLQALSLEFNGQAIPSIHPLLSKIAEQKVLKKLRLVISSFVHLDKETLKAIQKFGQLTHFDLQIHLVNRDRDENLKLVADCLENMKQLEDLKLHIFKNFQFESFDALELICQKINQLELLKHLDLCFVPLMVFTKIPNFLLLLQNIFTKSIKLQTLSLSYSQLDPTQALLDLVNLLQSSSTLLQKLKIYFGYCSPDLQSQELIIEFLKTLSSIQVLELSGIQIEWPNFFGQIIEAIYPLKCLRELLLGDMSDKIPLLEYQTALEAIITKRGLRKFRCKTSESLLKRCGFEEDRSGKLRSLQIDMRNVEVKNPCLESVYLSFPFFHFDMLKEFSE